MVNKGQSDTMMDFKNKASIIHKKEDCKENSLHQ